MKPKPMTKATLLLTTLLAVSAFSQTPPAVAPSAGPQPLPASDINSRVQRIVAGAAGAVEPNMTEFSLDFPGGTPKQLVAAIEKAMSKPLNAIIPPENADVKIPPLRMHNVVVPQLFAALERASAKVEIYPSGTSSTSSGIRPTSYQQRTTSYGFRTPEGHVSDESVWYFYVEKPTLPPMQPYTEPKICRYFPLTAYLDRGQSVDDITTAIQTGWKMLGEDDIPRISFHKETKLLIAVGDPSKLETIDAVLNALRSAPSLPSFIDPATGLPVPPSPALPERKVRTPKTPPADAGAAPGSTPAPAKP